MYFRLSNPTIEACDEEEMKALEKTKVDLKKFVNRFFCKPWFH